MNGLLYATRRCARRCRPASRPPAPASEPPPKYCQSGPATFYSLRVGMLQMTGGKKVPNGQSAAIRRASLDGPNKRQEDPESEHDATGGGASKELQFKSHEAIHMEVKDSVASPYAPHRNAGRSVLPAGNEQQREGSSPRWNARKRQPGVPFQASLHPRRGNNGADVSGKYLADADTPDGSEGAHSRSESRSEHVMHSPSTGASEECRSSPLLPPSVSEKESHNNTPNYIGSISYQDSVGIRNDIPSNVTPTDKKPLGTPILRQTNGSSYMPRFVVSKPPSTMSDTSVDDPQHEKLGAIQRGAGLSASSPSQSQTFSANLNSFPMVHVNGISGD